MRTLLCWIAVRQQFGKVLLENGWEKAPTWGCLFVHRQPGLYLSVYVNDIKMAGKKHNLESVDKNDESR